MLYRLIGTRPPNTRCYRIAMAYEVKHLESVAKVPDLGEIQREMEGHNTPGLFGEKSVLFVHTEHLPDELLTEIVNPEIFHRFCEVVAFTMVIHEVQPNPVELPATRNDSRALQLPVDSFAFTMPTENVDLSDSLSFSVEEARDVLGDFFPYAGKLIFLALVNHRKGGYYSAQEYGKTIIPPLMRDLAKPQKIILLN